MSSPYVLDSVLGSWDMPVKWSTPRLMELKL